MKGEGDFMSRKLLEQYLLDGWEICSEDEKNASEYIKDYLDKDE